MRWWDGYRWTGHGARPRRRPANEFRTLPLGAAVGAVTIVVLSLVAERLVLGALSGLHLTVVGYLVVAALVGYGPMLAYTLWITRRLGSGSLAADLGFRLRPADAGWGPLIWLSAYAAQIVVAIFVVLLRIPLSSNTTSIRELPGKRGVLVALALTAVLLAPLIEELVFRGVILRGLASRLPRWWAVVVQGVVFGAAHVDPGRGWGNIGLALVLSAVGVILGGAALLLGRIGPTILAHGLFNFVVVLIVLLT